MFPNDPNGLDPIALWVLLILSSGQRFTILELARILARPIESVGIAIQSLQTRRFTRNERGRFMIDTQGIEFLALRGIASATADDEPEPVDFIRWIHPPFFTSWREMFIWLVFPLILLIPAFVFSGMVTAGYNFISTDKIITQYLIWVIYLVLVGLYVWLSHYNLMENERLVIFRDGRARGRRGPGRVLILPLINNPRRVDLRERAKDIQREPCITLDNMVLNVGFYITWRIEDPTPSLTRVTNVEDSMSLLSAAMLRTAIAEFNMQDAMNNRRALNTLIRTRIAQKAADWGVVVNDTEIRELQPTDGVLKQIENRFNADLESAATLVKSNAKVQSLRDFLTIGEGMARNPIAFNLKYLDTLERIGEGASTKYIIPMEFFNFLRDIVQAQGGRGGDNNPGNGNNPPGQLPPGGPVQ